MQVMPVRRKQLWKDTLRCINTPGFVCNRGLKIRFVGEEAVDAGGPLRYWTHYMDMCQEGKFLCPLNLWFLFSKNAEEMIADF